MTHQQKQAHERLQTILPVRTHYSDISWDSVPRNNGEGQRPPRPCEKKSVWAEGKRYSSMTEAEKKTGLTRQNIYRRIARGWEGYKYA